MVASDRIVVMNKGRIIQAGAPEEIFDHPKTRFVAEFIGKTNILPGRAEGGDKIVLGEGLLLRVAPADGATSGEAFVCVRPHNLVLTNIESEARALTERGYNLFSGIVQRRIYFGDAIDYMIDLAPHPLKIRVVAPPSQHYDKGQAVFALACPEHCVVVNQG
jgi:putative spermidine/putrescine transport system ATP-binding protein